MRLIVLTTLSFLFLRTYAGNTFTNSNIQTVLDSTLCVTADSNTDGAEVYTTDCDPTNPGQVWASNGITTTAFGGTKCLDVTGGSLTPGTPMQIWTCTSNDKNQAISLNGAAFTWANTPECLDLTDGELCAGNQLQMWTCNGGSNQNQEWKVVSAAAAVPANTFQIKPQSTSSLCLTGGSTSGSSVTLKACNNPALQQWTETSTNTWRLSNNQCLDLPNGNAVSGQPLQTWTCTNNDPNQVFVKTTDNRLTFTNQCLDVTNGNTALPVQIFHCTSGDNNQAWNFVSVS